MAVTKVVFHGISTKVLRESGVEWLGEIPSDWKIEKIGNFYELRNEKVSDADFPPLSVTKKGVVPQLATAAKSDDHDNRKLVRKGDFAINSRSDRRGSCGISPYDGSVSLINTVLTPRGKMNPRYYNWLFHTERFADEFYKWGHGIVDDLWTTRWQEMKKIIIVVPPLSEQLAISDYLDDRCSQIDALVAEAKASIEEYKELKQAVIFEAVTKGIEKNVELVNLPYDEIGKISKSFSVVPLKYVVEYNRFSLAEDTESNYEFDYVDIGSVSFDSGIEHFQRMCFGEAPSRARRCVKENDIIISTVRTYLKAIAVIPKRNTPIIVSTGFITLTPTEHIIPRFLKYAVLYQGFITEVEKRSTGISYPAIKSTNIINIKVIIPPMNEQIKIADYLDKTIGNIDTLISSKESLISDLESYKKSLIYEVVTGKRRVIK